MTARTRIGCATRFSGQGSEPLAAQLSHTSPEKRSPAVGWRARCPAGPANRQVYRSRTGRADTFPAVCGLGLLRVGPAAAMRRRSEHRRTNLMWMSAFNVPPRLARGCRERPESARFANRAGSRPRRIRRHNDQPEAFVSISVPFRRTPPASKCSAWLPKSHSNSVTCKQFTRSAQSTGSKNTAPKRPISGGPGRPW